jgi:hypothetical protein
LPKICLPFCPSKCKVSSLCVSCSIGTLLWLVTIKCITVAISHTVALCFGFGHSLKLGSVSHSHSVCFSSVLWIAARFLFRQVQITNASPNFVSLCYVSSCFWQDIVVSEICLVVRSFTPPYTRWIWLPARGMLFLCPHIRLPFLFWYLACSLIISWVVYFYAVPHGFVGCSFCRLSGF